jgi:tetratricopeptide (TPR) repeat protein
MIRGDIKRNLEDYVGALEDLDKANVLEPNNAFTLMIRGDVKRNLEDYVGALEDLDKVDVLEPNNASTLRIRRDVKRNLEEYVGAFEDLEKVDVHVQNSFFIKQCWDVEASSKPKFSSICNQPNALKHLLMRGDFITIFCHSK